MDSTSGSVSVGARRASDAELSVWYANLDLGPDLAQELADTLSDDERERAARFHFERDRRRFAAARGILRSILGSILEVEPNRVRFRYGERGKPYLEHEFEGNLFFNVAHSAEHAMVAVADGADVGVDIEAIRPRVDPLTIADRYFSAAEREALHTVPAPLQLTAFFQIWTRKEAYIKALGDGLAHGLDRFDVPLGDLGPDHLQIIEDGVPAADWSLRDLSELPEYAAAVVAQGRPGGVQKRVWISPPGAPQP
jgi:4'-phosphopantetheinyl transferase